jgi:hypothetical protein
MENIIEFNNLFKKLDNVYKEYSDFVEMINKISELTEQNNNNIILINQLQDKIKEKDNIIKNKEMELKEYNKVSMSSKY